VATEEVVSRNSRTARASFHCTRAVVEPDVVLKEITVSRCLLGKPPSEAPPVEQAEERFG
jgi:hypothetical protein